jgi:hypothetical protein
MRSTSYLLPSVQRTIARFMNFSSIVEWSKKIINVYPKLDEKEKEAFGFVKNNHQLISGLDLVFQSVNKILKTIKNNGMSWITIDKCISILDSEINTDDELVRRVKEDIKTYLQEEKLKVKDDKDCLHASSDIIESMFGTYKIRRSKNRLNGITPYVLILPLITQMGKEKKHSNINGNS